MFELQEEQLLLQKAVREFVEQKIAPQAASWDEQDICPKDLFPKMGEMGLTGIFVPESYGGEGMGHFERALCLEEIARHSAGMAIALMTHHLGVYAILDGGNEEQKQQYLPKLASGEWVGGLSITESGGGSDFMGQQAKAELVDAKWLLNGRKCFITNSHIADVDVWTLRTGEDEKGRTSLTAFILNAGLDGYGPGRKEHKIGLRGSVTGDMVCHQVALPEDCVLGGIGAGAKLGMKTIGEVGRAGMAAIGVGILRGCLEESIKFAKERIIYGKPLAKLQSAQFIIAENRTAYEAAKLMLYNSVQLKDAGQPCATAIGMAKLFATEEAVSAAKRTMDLMGGYGCINEYPIGRFMRDALASIPAGGTSHIHKLVISGAALKE